MDDVRKEFLVESYEKLNCLNSALGKLEDGPSKETFGRMFSLLHNINSSCALLGYSKLESVTHAGENLLSVLCDGEHQVTPPINDALRSMIETVGRMLASIEAEGTEKAADDAALIHTLEELQRAQTFLTAPTDQPEKPNRKRRRKKKASTFGPNALSATPTAEMEPDVIESAVLEDIGAEEVGPLEDAVHEQQGKSKAAAVSDSTVRVDVELLDKLMNLVGELVLSRNQIMQFAAARQDETFAATSQHLNLVTGELQEGVMKTRMQPIGNVWNKFPRLVRDLAAACGKHVRVEMEGAETELDRTIIEAIKDPLTHVVSNAIDHGIESAEARLAAAKPAEGRLLLRAFHEGGQVNIEISDDGGGISPEKLRDKALQKDIITAERAARMSERELINLIFLPGFSTAEKITHVSGRGVGMDVVKANVEKIGGIVDVQSKIGEGTTLKIKIPLTLAIIPALMVSTGGDRYAIPQVSLLELVRLEGEQARKGVEMVHGAPVYRLRGNLLPLVYLNRELKLASQEGSDEAINIVVLQSDDRQFGLVVDSINDSKDIVVKPLGKHLKAISMFSGATILGDGKVALILDVIGISQSANIVSEARERIANNASATAQAMLGGRQTLLICRYNKEDRVGIPLSVVARLEQFPLLNVERSNTHEVVQYRGEIMPLIRLDQVLGGGGYDQEKKKDIDVVVYREQGKSVGLVVDQITDIVEERIAVRSECHGGHLLGTAVVQGKVTDILDVRGAIESVDPSYLVQQ
jgi:two-component system chemotaxis sensor kinase CheA